MATYDTVGTASVVFGATSITTASFTVTSSANRGVAVCVYHNANNATGITASCGGESGSLVTGTDSTTAQVRRTFIFGVPAAVSGSQTATCSWTTAMDAYLGALSYYDVDQTTPFTNGTTTNGSTGEPRITPTAGANPSDRSIGTYVCNTGNGNVQTPVLFHLTGTSRSMDGTEAVAGATHGSENAFDIWTASAVNVKTWESGVAQNQLAWTIA